MRNILANYDLWAVSANAKQTALGVEQTLDTSLLIDRSGVPVLDPRRETNADELTGKEEPDTVYDLGALSSFAMSFPKAQAQHFALAFAYGLGVALPAAWGTGYKHTITPIESLYLPCFTGAFRAGKTIFKRLFADLHVNGITATFAKDSWAKLSVDLKGTGKYTDNITKETITAAYNAASLTLAANGVQGADAATRLDNIQHVRVQVPSTGEWVDVVVTAASDATPAVLTITPPTTAVAIEGISKAAAAVVTWTAHGLEDDDEITIAGITQADWSALNATHVITKLTDDTFSIPVDTSAYTDPYAPETDPGTIINSTDADYEVLYTPTEAAWCTFPSRVIEPPLRVTDVVLKLGGLWNGTSLLGGHTLSDEIDTVEYSLNNDILTEFRIGGTGSYANYAIRQGRTQTLKLNREARDYILQQRIADNEYFSVYLKATGAEFETGKNYYVEILFPRCNVLKAPLSVNGKLLAEAGDLIVLEDDTYGSVRVEVASKVSAYAA
ncbi:MAG: hypothetical protein ABIJ37_03095 [Pseudomonadota bacterium]